MTYEERVSSMLSRVSSDVDKREGSVIYDAIGPCAWALTEQEVKADNLPDLLLPDTAVGAWLDRAVWPHVTRKQAVAAVREVTTSAEAEIGSRWAINDVVYVLTENTDTNTYSAECETPGSIGNRYTGALTALSGTSVTASIGDVLVEGIDEESDEALRDRFYSKIQYPVTSGNAYQYRVWALEVTGVGDAKIFPTENGAGTVGVYVVDTDRHIDADLLSPVSAHIEDVRPIGPTVTVKSPTAKTVNVTASLYLLPGASLDDIEDKIREELDKYFGGLVKSNYGAELSHVSENYRVSLARVGTMIMDIEGVSDYDTLELNGAGNVTVGPKEIPVIGTITLTEAN